MAKTQTKTVVGAVLIGVSLLVTGCGSYDSPKFRVVSVSETDRSDEAVVLSFGIEAINRNDEALPLERAEYSLTLDGVEVFEGTRIARVTAPRFGEQVLHLPAVVPASLVPVGRFEGSEAMRYGLRGSVEYQTPGRFSEFLFDLNVRRPKARLDLGGTLELAPGS